jgi:hypothetical protein
MKDQQQSDLEAQLGQVEYSVGALREQLTIVRRRIDEFRKRETPTAAIPAERVAASGHCATLDI